MHFNHVANSAPNLPQIHLFFNENIKFYGKSHFFKSFLSSGLLTIRDAWDEEIRNFKDSIQIYNSLFPDNWNCIAEYSQIKAAVPSTFFSITKARKIKLVDVSLLSNCNNFIKPKAKIKWVNEYDKEI